MTTTPDHNAAGQRPTEADKKEVEPQASDSNRQRARTLQAEGLDDEPTTASELAVPSACQNEDETIGTER